MPTLIAIPTTAGTGSETTLAAVITDSEKKHNPLYPVPRLMTREELEGFYVRWQPPGRYATESRQANLYLK